MEKYKKLDHQKLSFERFEMKGYLKTLSLENSCMRYMIDSSVIPTVRAHFSRKYKPRSMTCPGCSDTTPDNKPMPTDTTEHILLACENYSDLKDDYFDPEDDKMLAEFFRRVVKRRIDNGHD